MEHRLSPLAKILIPLADSVEISTSSLWVIDRRGSVMNREGAHEYLLDAVIAGRLVVASNGFGLFMRRWFGFDLGDYPWR